MTIRPVRDSNGSLQYFVENFTVTSRGENTSSKGEENANSRGEDTNSRGGENKQSLI